MSKRRRPKPRRARRPTHKRHYPSPAERDRIVSRRSDLLEELVSALVLEQENKRTRRINKLVRKYGPQEVAFILDVFQKSTQREFIGEEALLYRGYRRTFARFGGNRPFLNKQEHEDLVLENAMLATQRKFKSFIRRSPSPRERELHDLLLLQVEYWENITPLSVPPRPVDFDAPPPGQYDYPVRTLLKWGWDLDEQRIADNSKNVAKWCPAIPELARMVFDEGLLDGWPGEASSWVPYHALHMLGHLHAHEYAGRLLALLDQENDWLSDRLPSVWAQIGPQAEPPLWTYMNDRGNDPQKRSNMLMGLRAIAQAHPERRPDIIGGLARHLQQASADDAEMNGYIVFVLNRMQAVEAGDAIIEAFERGIVDLSIMQLPDVSFLRDQVK